MSRCMFRTADLVEKVSLSEFNERELLLQQEVLEVRRQLREDSKFQLVIVFAGVAGRAMSIPSTTL